MSNLKDMSDMNNMLENLLIEQDSVINKEKIQERYSNLVKAIEFFSQRFSLNNMNKYMVEFCVKLLNPVNAVLIVEEDNQYIVSSGVDEDAAILSFPKEDKHDKLVYFHAGLLNEAYINSFTSEEVMKAYKPSIGIPLVMDKTLYGFILLQREELMEDEVIVANALMNLYHLSLTNYIFYNRLEQVNHKLDQTIFNLFAINQASKALVTELNQDKLLDLTLSVFAELTQSAITSVFIYDDINDSFVCKSAWDVYGEHTFRPIELQKSNYKNDEQLVIVDYSNTEQLSEFSKCFLDSVELLNYYEPKYIISLVNAERFIGFITISKRTKDEDYDHSLIELIESLASATYIALTNASYFEEVTLNRANIKRQLDSINRLNRLIKNVNTADNIENLIELTLQTLKVSFGYKMNLFAIRRDNCFNVMNTKGFGSIGIEIELTVFEDRLIHGDTIVSYDTDEVVQLFTGLMDDDFRGSVQGMIMVPVYIDELEFELQGVICLFDVAEGVLSSDQNIITLETIAGHIAPIIKQMKQMDMIKANYKLDGVKLFKDKLDQSIEEADSTDSKFYVLVVKRLVKQIFDSNDNEEFSSPYPYSYYLDNNHIAIVCYSVNKLHEIEATYTGHNDILTMEYDRGSHSVIDMFGIITNFVY